jgi:hypothetical protein
VLLRAVVQVAFNASPLGVGGRDQPPTRRLQLGRLPAQLLKRVLQRRVQVSLLQRHPKLARHLFERDVDFGCEAFALAGTLGHDEAK